MTIDGPKLLADAQQAVRGSDLPGGIALAKQALDGGFEHPLLLNLRALDHERQGRPDLALIDLERARSLAPEDWGLANAAGLCLAQLGRTLDAVDAFARAIALQPAFAQAHYNKGWSIESAGDLVEAQRCYEQAIAIKPDYADALAKLALLAVRRGQHDAAVAWADQALGLDPRQPSARLALAAAEISRGAGAAAETRLGELLADHEITPFDRAMANNALGNALDAQDRSGEAFAAYAASNTILRDLNAPHFEAPGQQSAVDYVRMVDAYFSKAPASFWRRATQDGRPSATAAHVFLLGFPRSGTTLLESVLASHPQVTVLEEKETLNDATRALMRNPSTLDLLVDATAETLEPYRQSYWRYVREHCGETSGRVVVDKMPMNTAKLPLIAKLFPEARIIFAVRDPRDVVLSCFRRQFRMNPSMYEFLSLERAAAFYDAVMGFGDACLGRIELPVHTHAYERLVADFDGTVRQVCDFIGVPWDEQLRNFADRARGGLVATTSSPQVARGLYADATDQWRRYAAQLAPVLPVLKRWVDRFGYAEA